MNSKKKMIIAISAFAMVVLAAVVAVVAVLAAQSVTVKSTIRVTYTSSEIAGTVTAKYQIAGGTATNIGTGSITYAGTETGTPTTSLTSQELSITGLTSSNNYVDFIFTFTNTSSSAYTATVTLPTTSSNFTISYPTTPTGINAQKNSFSVAANTTTPVTYTVRYTITNVSQNASLSGDFAWNLA